MPADGFSSFHFKHALATGFRFWFKLRINLKITSPRLCTFTVCTCSIRLHFLRGFAMTRYSSSVPGCQVCVSASRSKVFRNRSIYTLSKYLGNTTWIISCSANTVNTSTGMLFIIVSKQPLESRETQPGNDFVVKCFDVNFVDVAPNLLITIVCDQTSE